MKKTFFVLVVSAVFGFAASAYNPPIGGDVFYQLSSPRQLTNGNSVTGGPLFFASPESIVVNPAITAKEQRVDLNLAYTLLFGSNSDNGSSYGNAFQAGILIPFKWAVLSGYMNGTMVSLEQMNIGDSITVKAGLSKEITDKLNVGFNINSGFFWGADTDWAFSANLGFLYNWGNLGFMKDFRYGASVLNLGKNFAHTTLPKLSADNPDGAFPTIGTIKLGAAGTLLQTNAVKLGASLDLTAPLCMNLIADIGLQCSIKDMIFINIADQFNVRELANGYKNIIPSIGISFRFTFNVKNSEYLEKNGWNQSEMSISSAWKQLYKSVNAVSAGVDLNLGLKDETPPIITIMLEDEED